MYPDSPLLYPEHPKLSLMQVYDIVTASIDDMIRHCAVSAVHTNDIICLFL